MLLAACNQHEKNVDPALTANLSSDALTYLFSALDTLHTHSVNRDSIDWTELRKAALEHAQGATHPADTYPALKEALRLLEDRHSFFIPPEEATQWETNTIDQVPVLPDVEMLGDRIGYVTLPGALALNADSVQQYVARLHRLIREVDAANPCGWMLDLRSNWGGNMWAMLAGIRPILGEGLVGMAVYPDGRQAHWSYADDRVLMDTTVMVESQATSYQLGNPSTPVAVLTSRSTASSGEAITVAFRGRAHARSFGEGTAGVATGNKTFMLGDGAAIALTIARFADRTGRVYVGSVEPDVVVLDSDEADETAIEWLEAQPSCQGSGVAGS